MAASKLQAFWNHPAGPKTIHFWAPTFKWDISIATVADLSKPPDVISYPQQVDLIGDNTVFRGIRNCDFTVLAGSGLIWTRYGMVINPINWNLSSVNMAMAVTGMFQLTRKIKHDYFSGLNIAPAEDEPRKS